MAAQGLMVACRALLGAHEAPLDSGVLTPHFPNFPHARTPRDPDRQAGDPTGNAGGIQCPVVQAAWPWALAGEIVQWRSMLGINASSSRGFYFL